MKIVIIPALLTFLAACSGAPITLTTPVTQPGSTTIGSAAHYAAGNYQVVQGSFITDIAAPATTSPPVNGVQIDRWVAAGGIVAVGYADANVVAAGGLNNGTYFSGITGNTSATIPTTGTANYTGRYSLVVVGGTYTGNLNLTADFAAGTLTDTNPTIVVNGTINGGDVTGTVDYLGESGTLKGGFYNNVAGGVVGAVLGTNIAGVIAAN